MAKLIDIKCPKCSAPVHIAADATSVTCRYCGGTSMIERGRPVVEAKNVAPAHHHVPGPGAAPKVMAMGVAFMVMVGASSAIFFVRARDIPSFDASGRPVATATATAAVSQLHFADPPMLADVNGDGALDVVGSARESSVGEAITAFDGTSGAVLWRGPLLTKDATAGGALRGIALGRVVSVDALGKVQAYDVQSGNPAWSALLGEQARKICEAKGLIVIQTSDDARHGLDPATGKKTEVDAKAPCTPVYSTERDEWPTYRIIDWPDMKASGLPEMSGVEGMTAHRALVSVGPGPKFMLGQRDKGTAVPMIAAIGEHRKVLWKDVVPGVDPLTAESNTSGMVAAVQGNRLLVPYALKDSDAGSRMACFDVTTGQRLWDVQTLQKDDNTNGFAVSPERIFITAWFEPGVVLSIETGEVLYKLGGS